MSGLYITKAGYNALTDTNLSHFSLDTDYNTFKYINPTTGTPLQTTISVSNMGGTHINTTVTRTLTLPSNSPSNPYLFTYIADNNGFEGYDYINNQNIPNFYILSAIPVFGSNTVTCSLQYDNAGTTSYSVTFYVFCFANAF